MDKISEPIQILIALISGIIYVIIIVELLLNNNKSKCINMSNFYNTNPSTISNTNFNINTNQYSLYDYYIKSSYNSCRKDCNDTTVDLCALKECIKQGYRFLDFELFYENKQPIISCSTSPTSTLKGVNSITFSSAIKTINDYAFTNHAPNPNDPLILNFRFKTINKEMCNSISSSLYNYLDTKMLGPSSSYQYSGNNIGAKPLNELKNKILISVDCCNNILQGTKLNEYVNISTYSGFIQTLNINGVEHYIASTQLPVYNETNMTICTPSGNKNYDYTRAKKEKCQFIAMAAQCGDQFLINYINYFNDVGYAFILKNKPYTPKLIAAPKKQSKQNSYATTTVHNKLYKLKL